MKMFQNWDVLVFVCMHWFVSVSGQVPDTIELCCGDYSPTELDAGTLLQHGDPMQVVTMYELDHDTMRPLTRP